MTGRRGQRGLPGYGYGVDGMAGPVDGPGAPMARSATDVQRSRLGRVIDVGWWAPFTAAPPLGSIRGPRYQQGHAFGGLQFQPQDHEQLDEEDWMVYAQPLNVLPFDRPPAEFYPYGAPVAWDPRAWWPDVFFNHNRSPFSLLTTCGPETGVYQVTPIPAVGCAVAVRGRNVSATIVYDAGATFPAEPPPYEGPRQTEGDGQIALVIAKAQPTSQRLSVQSKSTNFLGGGGLIVPTKVPAFLPKFSVALPYQSAFTGLGNLEYVSPTGQAIIAGDAATLASIPFNAVALRSGQSAEDIQFPMAAVFEVFQ